jgi:hypothetical protein
MTRVTEHYLLAKESGRWGYYEFPGAFGLDDSVHQEDRYHG